MKIKPRVVVLRWGHRIRDERLTTHVVLTARAFGAEGVILADVEDKELQKRVDTLVSTWGGPFYLKSAIPWRAIVRDWRKQGGIVVHLTAYGNNIADSEVIRRIRESGRDLLVLVGSQKVPRQFFGEEVSDFNIAVGNTHHSECSALAVFLDHLFDSKELKIEFRGAKKKILPCQRGKRVVSVNEALKPLKIHKERPAGVEQGSAPRWVRV